ncbi:60S ribosomal protein L28 [Striga asiatica]|uniref:60S ribosomal protein L28 n=1 Tax=Striga asiatica TaxID=4170 RepID=A0A5A7R512_STRAF|nr:60S ribosomal protein L28 [Striga asiatica]
MASSGKGPNKGINGSVGKLIWVRQQNGLWWPGKILDPDKLPKGSVPSPRSGTPVKLLGKEGSSVLACGFDECVIRSVSYGYVPHECHVGWYNLEKSKRVKAFHYEDHDKCIEKLKSSKYAKKDEGSLHMLKLELERARLDKNHTDHESLSESHLSEESENSDKSLIILGDDLGSGSMEESRGLNDLEEKVSRRTRGLRDLGTKAPLLRKRKMSEIVNNQDILKKKNKRRTLTKASVHDDKKMSSSNGYSLFETKESKEKNSASVGFSCDDALKSKRKGNGISSKTFETKSSSLFDVPLIAEEKHSAAGKGDYPEWQSKGKRKSRSRKTYPLHGLETRAARFNRAGPRSLHDVPLEVSSGPGRGPNCLPYISMASKLTGCSVVGHPLTVELLASGSCDEYLKRAGGPRNRKVRRPDSGKNGLLLKKTRKLSALSGPHRLGRDDVKKGPSVACVPLAVVFSRINATMATVPGQLIWEIVRKNNSFLVKQFGNGTASVKFSKEPNNLYNVHSFKYSGLANKKTVTIQPGKDQSVLLATTKTKKQNMPANLLNKSVMKKEFQRMAKAVENQVADNNYRPDLKKAALARLSAVNRSLKVAKSGVKKRNRQA